MNSESYNKQCWNSNKSRSLRKPREKNNPRQKNYRNRNVFGGVCFFHMPNVSRLLKYDGGKNIVHMGASQHGRSGRCLRALG